MRSQVSYRRLAAWFAKAAALLALLIGGAVLLNMRAGDRALFPPRPGETSYPIYVVSYGYHSGLIISRDDLVREAEAKKLSAIVDVLDRFRDFDFLEFGWGDEGFYQHARSVNDVRWSEALRALFWPGNTSVLHVVGLRMEPRAFFPLEEMVQIGVSDRGLAHLSAALDQSFGRDENGRVKEMGPGLYGPSLFYHATGTFSLLNVCNHWVAHLLSDAGVPTNPFLSALPKGLFWDLSLRAHVKALPRSLP